MENWILCTCCRWVPILSNLMVTFGANASIRWCYYWGCRSWSECWMQPIWSGLEEEREIFVQKILWTKSMWKEIWQRLGFRILAIRNQYPNVTSRSQLLEELSAMSTWCSRYCNENKFLLPILCCICYQELLRMHWMIQWKALEFQIDSPKDAPTWTQSHCSHMELGDGCPCHGSCRLH